jgi:hypothetical protein
MVRKLFLILLGLATVLSGCTYSGTIRTDIAPTAMVANKYSSKVGVYFTPRLSNYQEITKPSTYYGSAHTFTFNMGPALKEALTKSVEAAYSNVSVLNTPPRAGESDRVITFDLQNSNVRIEFVPGFWRSAAKSNAVVHVSMEIMDGSTLKAFQRLSVNGNGFATKDTRGGSDAQRQFSMNRGRGKRSKTECSITI